MVGGRKKKTPHPHAELSILQTKKEKKKQPFFLGHF